MELLAGGDQSVDYERCDDAAGHGSSAKETEDAEPFVGLEGLKGCFTFLAAKARAFHLGVQHLDAVDAFLIRTLKRHSVSSAINQLVDHGFSKPLEVACVPVRVGESGMPIEEQGLGNGPEPTRPWFHPGNNAGTSRRLGFISGPLPSEIRTEANVPVLVTVET